MAVSDEWNRAKIISAAISVIEQYDEAITIRQLYYRLVAAGMPNNLRMYKRLDAAMTEARWNGQIAFGAFVDRGRRVVGVTESDLTDVDDKIDEANEQIRRWLTDYRKNRWENQDLHVEVWVEKQALEGVFLAPCDDNGVALAPCKGYPSLSFLDDAAERFRNATKPVKILYFGDHDPSGDDIPRSLHSNLSRMGAGRISITRVALTQEQIEEWGLPGVPPKTTDSRTYGWDGESAVELDAVEPKMLKRLITDAINGLFDKTKHGQLLEQERAEREKYRKKVKTAVQDLIKEWEE
jgi:hypothetical protein